MVFCLLDLDDTVSHTENSGLLKRATKRPHEKKEKNPLILPWNAGEYDRLRQIAIYLLCWGEAAQVRFIPECLCFIFK